jgi:hypothetical protein
MACPYFWPTQRLQAAGWRGKIRPPLGDLYEGECHARAREIHSPGGAVLLECCNFGYAARQCRRFPAQEGPEAVRFCVREDAEGKVHLDYVMERAHLPYEHGGIVYDRGLRAWTGLQAGSLLERQAQAYVESYLTWKDGEKARPEPRGGTVKSQAAGGRI